jgi:DNA-binding response OmpR family regulator
LSKKILIIEDEDEFYFFYEMMLENTDYAVKRAIDGDQAFEMIKNEKPDLIILDLLLDQMKGEDFLRQLKSDPQHASIPIIIASSFSPRSFKAIFEVDPNLTFLEKPFSQEKLLAEIKVRIG